MPNLSRAAAALVIMAIVARAAPPNATGPTCVSCHREQARSQPETSMALALARPATDEFLKTHAKLALRLGRYSYVIERRGDQSIYTVTDGTDTLSLPIAWSFGARSRTFVVEREGRFYETFVSYYPAISGLDITLGDQKLQPQSILEAMGRELGPREARDCFQCHATGAVDQARLQINTLIPGVQCEHCHAGTGSHTESFSSHKAAAVPAKLSKLSAEETSNFCGQCHRSWEQVVRSRLFGQSDVRFQPYRLASSKCFDGVDKRISCTSCHDPHREVVRDATAYDANCLACHGPAVSPESRRNLQEAAHAGPPRPALAKACPVAQSACSSCHMPKVELPGGHQIFTDHNIRIVKAGEPFPD